MLSLCPGSQVTCSISPVAYMNVPVTGFLMPIIIPILCYEIITCGYTKNRTKSNPTCGTMPSTRTVDSLK
jgi:hypothetical protein